MAEHQSITPTAGGPPAPVSDHCDERSISEVITDLSHQTGDVVGRRSA